MHTHIICLVILLVVLGSLTHGPENAVSEAAPPRRRRVPRPQSPTTGITETPLTNIYNQPRTQPVPTPAVQEGTVNVVQIPQNRIGRPDPDNYNYAGDPNYRYNGPETALIGKERFFVGSPTFKTWDRFKATPKEQQHCQQAQNIVFGGYRKFFDALKLKIEADVSLAIGQTTHYNEILERYRELYRTSKAEVVTGTELLYKVCSFSDLVCFLTNAAKWREIQYREILNDLATKAENAQSTAMQNEYMVKIRFIEKKLVLLRGRLTHREELIQNLTIQCPSTSFLTVNPE